MGHDEHYEIKVIDKRMPLKYWKINKNIKKKHSFSNADVKAAYYAMLFNYYQSNAFDHKNNKIKSNFQDLHFEIRNKLEKIQPSSFTDDVDVEIWHEVSGAGKTQAIFEQFDVANDLYIAPTTELMQEFRTLLEKRHPKMKSNFPCKTHEVVLLSEFLYTRKRIFVDEVFTHAYQYPLLLMALNPTAKFILVGDSEQTEHLDEYGRLPANSQLINYMDKFKNIKYNRYTWRFHDSVCSLLQHTVNYMIWPHPDIRKKKNFFETIITRSKLENRPKADLEISFSGKAQKFLLEMTISALTAKTAQGKSKPVVNVFFTHFDYEIVAVRALTIVALSRASHQLNIVEHDPVTADKVIGAFGPIETISDAYNPAIAPENYYISNQLQLIEDQYEKSIPPPSLKFDHNLLCEMLTISDSIKVRDEEFILAEPKFNKFTGELERTKADKLVEYPDTFTNIQNQYEAAYVPNQINKQTRNLKLQKYSEIKEKITKTFTQTQFGKTYHVSNNRQTLFTSIKRAQRKRKLPPIKLGRIKGIWKRIRKYMLRDELVFTDLNNDLAKALTELYRKRIKNDEMPKNIDGVLEPMHLIAREFQKDITKIKGVGATLKDKVGQPIKAFAQEVNAAFCTYFRAVEDRFVGNLKENVIYANKHSEEDLNEKLNNISGYTVISGLDCSEFDGSQNSNTIKIEAEIVSNMWDNPSKEIYYEMRRFFKVLNELFSYFNEEVKPSGGSDTLMGNSFTNAGIIANCVEFLHMIALVIKGDDSWVFSRGQPWRKGLITTYVDDYVLMDMKVSTPEIPEFCGSLYVNGCYFYNFPVLAAKILTRNYSDEEDLRSYQNAVRDKLKVYYANKELVDAVVGRLLNADSKYGEQFMELIRSFAEIKYNDLVRNLIDIDYVNDVINI